MIEGIVFTIGFRLKEYLLGTPIVARLQLTNKGSRPVSLIDQLAPEYEVVKFEIRKDNERSVFKPYTVLDAVPHVVSLEPGNTITGFAKLFYGAKEWTLSTPGLYRIKASYRGLVDDPNQVIQSNEVELEIKAPANKEEQEQVGLIMGDEQGKFLLLEGGDHLTNGIESLTELTRKYPNSELTKFANFSLGINSSTEFADFSKMKLRPPNTEKSVSHLEAAKPKLHGYYANKAYLTLADLYDKTNDKSRKKATLNEFVNRFSADSIHQDTVKKAEKMLENSN